MAGGEKWHGHFDPLPSTSGEKSPGSHAWEENFSYAIGAEAAIFQ